MQDLAPRPVDTHEWQGQPAHVVPEAELGSRGQGGRLKPAAKRAHGSSYEVGLKVLILSATGNGVVEVASKLAEQTLSGLGIPFDHVALSKGGVRVSEGPLDLEDPGHTSGKYYGIILTSETLGLQAPDGTWHSALTDAQWTQLDAYEQKYQVRRVALSGYPRLPLGVTPAGNARTDANALQTTNAATPFSSGMVPGAVVQIPSAWQNPGRIVDPQVATAFATFTLEGTDGTPDPVAAVVSNLPNGRQQLTFFLSQSVFLDASYYLSPLWVSWMTRGVYLGERRLYLNVQVDDFYLASAIWNPTTGFAVDDLRTYTLTVDDFTAFVAWQRGQQARFPADSTFRVEMCVNGAGVWSNPEAGYSQAVYQTAQRNIDEFNWVSHTFTHPSLDILSINRATYETMANQQFEQDFIGSHQERFSPHSLVTPMYTGLFSTEALRAMYQTGIRNVVGDNSQRTHWPLNFYHGITTNQEKNGFDGIFVLPRSTTVLPVSSGTPYLLESFYNSLYHNVWGRNLATDEILTREAQRVARLVLSYRRDLYMFHQANMWSFLWPETGADQRRVSLLGLWTEYLGKALAEVTTLPVLSAKIDDLADLFRQRIKYDNCQFDGRLVVQNGAIVAVHGRARQACRVPITGIVTDDQANVSHEIYGPDRTTWIDVTPHADVAVQLTTQVPL